MGTWSGRLFDTLAGLRTRNLDRWPIARAKILAGRPVREAGLGERIAAMTTHPTTSKVLLVAAGRVVATDGSAVALRRYRLARIRLEGRGSVRAPREDRSTRR